ncbi:MAG: pyridoxamine 5'-phosphate oxidase family protein [Dehalococcoidia bacterium]|nr:pyridoxamine 5'-phosphate oxidase family protein [Dehalococcoidia bacterium]
MATWYHSINDTLREIIEQQHMFFVATAPADPGDGWPNVSAKGRTLLRVLAPNLVGYLDYPGSGNETAKHVEETGRITLMVCRFDATAGIVRLYGRGRRVELDDPELIAHRDSFADDFHPFVRQAFLVDVEKVQTSCGYGVPRMQYLGDRDTLDKWCERKLEPRAMVDGLPAPGALVYKE